MTIDREVTGLSYLQLSSRRLPEWQTFAAEIMGVPASVEPSTGSVLLRMDERYRYSVEVVDGPGETVSAIGWDVRDSAALDAVTERVRAAGYDVHEAGEQECSVRDATRICWFVDPDGVRTDLVYGRRWLDEPILPVRPSDGIRGLGHVTLATGRIDDYLTLYQDVLRFRLSDFRSGKLYFLGCNARHHSIALAASGAASTHHFFLDLASLDDVGRSYDIARNAGCVIEAELGRHGNDRAVSFYVKNPSGYSTECGWGAIEVDDATWVTHEFTRGDLWGHQRNADEAAKVALSSTVATPQASVEVAAVRR